MSWVDDTVSSGAFNSSNQQKQESLAQQQLSVTSTEQVVTPKVENVGPNGPEAQSSEFLETSAAGPSQTLNATQAVSVNPRATSMPLELQHHTNLSVGYAYDPQMLLHASMSDHPEQPARIKQIHRTLRDNGLLKVMRLIPVRPVRKNEVLLVHSEDHWEKVEAISRRCILINEECTTLTALWRDHRITSPVISNDIRNDRTGHNRL